MSRGVRVLVCRPAESEARFSFAGLADLLEPVLGEALSNIYAKLGVHSRTQLARQLGPEQPEWARSASGRIPRSFLGPLRLGSRPSWNTHEGGLGCGS